MTLQGLRPATVAPQCNNVVLPEHENEREFPYRLYRADWAGEILSYKSFEEII